MNLKITQRNGVRAIEKNNQNKSQALNSLSIKLFNLFNIICIKYVRQKR